METLNAFHDEKMNKPELCGLRILLGINLFLIVTDFLMPQYFGVHIGWDITCTRLANMLLCGYCLFNPGIVGMFLKSSVKHVLIVPVMAYLFVAAYTCVFRVDVNAFVMVFLELLTMYMLVFGIRFVIGIRRTIRIIIGCAYFLGLYGMVEAAFGYSLYLKFLKTVPTAVTNCYRSGHYRIMGPCGHPLGYGLLLLLFLAIACYDYDRDKIYIFKRPLLVGLLIINVFLTGSRSSLGIAAVEMVVIFFLSDVVNMKKTLFFLGIFVICFAIFLALTYKTSIGRYILMQIFGVFDHIFGTTISARFGADVTHYANSDGYREVLPKIFGLDWLNPILGRGVKRHFSATFTGEDGSQIFVSSIDSYYIEQYIKYAYPGMISYIIFIFTALGIILRNAIKYRSGLFKLIFVGVLCYYYNLYWLDALQTLKFAYVFIALALATSMFLEGRLGVENTEIENEA